MCLNVVARHHVVKLISIFIASSLSTPTRRGKRGHTNGHPKLLHCYGDQNPNVLWQINLLDLQPQNILTWLHPFRGEV